VSVTVINNGRGLRKLQNLRDLAAKPPLRLRRKWVVRQKRKKTARLGLLGLILAGGIILCLMM